MAPLPPHQADHGLGLYLGQFAAVEKKRPTLGGLKPGPKYPNLGDFKKPPGKPTKMGALRD